MDLKACALIFPLLVQNTCFALEPANPDIRYRHVTKLGWHFYILFNEGPHAVATTIAVPVPGRCLWLDPSRGDASEAALDRPVAFRAHELKILAIAAAARRR